MWVLCRWWVVCGVFVWVLSKLWVVCLCGFYVGGVWCVCVGSK